MGEPDLKGILKPQRDKEKDVKNTVKHLKAQIAHVQKQYKLMEREKLSEAQKMTIALAQQKSILNKLTEDQMNLIDDGQTCVSEKDSKKVREFYSKVATQIQEKAYLEDEIENLRKEIRDLDKKNMKICAEIQEREINERKRTERFTGDPQHADRLVGMLDNKLSVMMVELNKTLGTCREYRLEIEELLRERDRFKDLMNSVLNKLMIGKGLMLDMIEQATLAFEKRDEAKMRMQALEQRHKIESETQAKLIQEFHHALKVDIDKAIFYSIKCQKRVMGDLEANKRMNELVDRQAMENKIYQSKLFIAQIKELYHVGSLDEALEVFKNTQIETMGLFSYVIHIFCEATNIASRNKLLKFGIEEAWKNQLETKKEQTMKLEKLKEEYEQAKLGAKTWATRLEYAQSFVQFCLFRLNKMFVKAGCTTENFRKKLGDIDFITVNNAEMMLKEVEKKMIGLVAALYKVERETMKDKLPLRRCILNVPKKKVKMKTPTDVGMLLQTPCPLCTEQERMVMTREVLDTVGPYNQLEYDVKSRSYTQPMQDHLHSISACRLPGSRRLMQQRFLLLGS